MIPVNFLAHQGRALLLGLATTGLLLVSSGCGGKLTTADSNVALGEVMGKKTAELLGGRGSVVILISEADGVKSPGLAKSIEAVKQALGDKIKVSAVENLQLQPLPGLPLFSPQQFVEVLQKHAAADALISFVMLPKLPSAVAQQLPSPRPKVVSLVGVPFKNLFAQQVVYLAVLPKPEMATVTAKTTQALFDAKFQLVTPETAGALPF